MGRSSRGGSAAKQYDWEAAFIAQTVLAAGVSAQFTLFSADAAETLVRMRGMVTVTLDASGNAAGDMCIVGFGLIVVSAGATVAVSPVTDGNANWFWHTMIPLASEVLVDVVDSAQILASAREVIDNKAMRRLREVEDVVLVVENADVTGAPPAVVGGAFCGLM